ncbi:MAG: hypothetical protein KF912_13250 [Phycisphaeraceae bacterium]|nr:hypothetical protein [Phycisphaeraceae bacterium]MBX3368272.1 hypothetical protein [Phycisphaeraceae bacterium]
MLTLAEIHGQVITIVAISGGIFIAVISIILSNIRRVITTRAIEQSRRELAAYVAEGSISPDEAERLLKAGPAAARQGGC